MTVTIELTEEQIAQVAEPITLYGAKQPKVTEPQDVVAYLSHLKRLKQEHTLVVTLDSRSRIIGRHVVSKGTLDAALVHPREIFRHAIEDNAATIILAHNHPSGDCEPSEDDLMITRRLVTAGKVMGIALDDHVVVASSGYYSFQEHGQI